MLVLSFVPSLVSADEPSLVQWAKQRIEVGLVTPLSARERPSRFSRARPPPQQRRVQVSETLLRDKQGREFVPFQIDEQMAHEWRDRNIVGCVYRATGNLFVKRGEAYVPAAYLLGKKLGPVPGACEAAPANAKS